MLAYVARRLALAVGTVLAAVVIVFLLVHATPGSPGAIRLGPGATPAEIAAENADLGWDRPLLAQFGDYLGNLVQGNFGTSLIDKRDIAADLTARLPVTASIALLATLLSGVLGVVLGVTAAVRGGRLGRIINSASGVAPAPRRMAPGLPGVACTSRKTITTAARTVPMARASRRAT